MDVTKLYNSAPCKSPTVSHSHFIKRTTQHVSKNLFFLTTALTLDNFHTHIAISSSDSNVAMIISSFFSVFKRHLYICLPKRTYILIFLLQRGRELSGSLRQYCLAPSTAFAMNSSSSASSQFMKNILLSVEFSCFRRAKKLEHRNFQSLVVKYWRTLRPARILCCRRTML